MGVGKRGILTAKQASDLFAAWVLHDLKANLVMNVSGGNVPFKSVAQQKWGNSPAGVKALGAAGVKEWNAATRGKKLPKRKVKQPSVKLSSLIKGL